MRYGEKNLVNPKSTHSNPTSASLQSTEGETTENKKSHSPNPRRLAASTLTTDDAAVTWKGRCGVHDAGNHNDSGHTALAKRTPIYHTHSHRSMRSGRFSNLAPNVGVQSRIFCG